MESPKDILWQFQDMYFVGYTYDLPDIDGVDIWSNFSSYGNQVVLYNPEIAESPTTAQPEEQNEVPDWRELLNCRYCRENGEDEVFIRSHALRDRKGILMCPILMRQTCPQCLATGDQSHELSECPLNKSTVTNVEQTEPEPEQSQIKTPSIQDDDAEDGGDDESKSKIGNKEYGASLPEIIAESIRKINEKRKLKRMIRCVFCRYHQKGKKIFKTHNLRDDDGLIICPILREVVCPMCSATGSVAHTLEYCPIYRKWRNEPKNGFR